ncbi:MAG: hypothetical protein M0R80_08000 [Proteobacteria bacterium]|jgi:hypothetical protein|nr:hypothetical protein [Pseudomonadota bacterium]
MEAAKCRECGCRNIAITDCGYSSFNVGRATCTQCGFVVKVSPCGCFPRDEIIAVWNQKNSKKGKKADLLREKAKKLDEAAKKLDKEALNNLPKE